MTIVPSILYTFVRDFSLIGNRLEIYKHLRCNLKNTCQVPICVYVKIIAQAFSFSKEIVPSYGTCIKLYLLLFKFYNSTLQAINNGLFHNSCLSDGRFSLAICEGISISVPGELVTP